MFEDLAKLVDKDSDYPARTHRIDVLSRVLDGTIYDALKYSFHDEENESKEYIPLQQRKPSVRTGIIRSVVDDSVSLLFSEGHFPQIQCEDSATKDSLQAIIKDARVNVAMIEAATRGSVGSVCILVRFLSKRVFLTVKDTRFLTPTWDPNEPDKLLKVIEQYKVRGDVLKASGYPIPDEQLVETFWFKVEWNRQEEVWYLPAKRVAAETPVFQVDTSRTVKHGLGFVPAEWVKNLPGGTGDDGASTFGPEPINTVIQADYQLSQAGRGLRYSSDPTLLIKEPAQADGKMIKSASNAIVVDKDGDASLLEIDGAASAAVIAYVDKLRELAIESMHGNRSTPDKLSAAQSGRALEMLHQSLIWLADKLRASYGETALLNVFRMIVAGSQKYPIEIRGKKMPMSTKAELSLKWPAWFPPTADDIQTMATGLSTLIKANSLSRETAVRILAAAFDIEDVKAEMALITAERQQLLAELPDPATKIATTE
jgi:hypothetical protein